MLLLAALFALTAALYASVGFGGGSTYTALLAFAETDYRVLPAISLVCNIVVVTGGTIRFARAGLLPWRRVLPLVLMSAPLALLGGLTPIRQAAFLTLLGASLLVAGLLLLFQRDRAPDGALRKTSVGDLGLGAGIGYLSGLVGIGGGIFLAPLLNLTRWDAPKPIAATASLFILVNSIAGLTGQLLKLGDAGTLPALAPYWPLAVAVLIGGQIGSLVSVRLLRTSWVRRATAVLVLYVAARLLWQQLG